VLVELFGGFQQRSLGWVGGGCAKVGSFNMSGMLNSLYLRLRHSRPAVVEQQAGYHCRCRNRTATYTHSLSTAQHMNSCTSGDSHMSICFICLAALSAQRRLPAMALLATAAPGTAGRQGQAAHQVAHLYARWGHCCCAACCRLSAAAAGARLPRACQVAPACGHNSSMHTVAQK
jgi:hypothetical protein